MPADVCAVRALPGKRHLALALCAAFAVAAPGLAAAPNDAYSPGGGAARGSDAYVPAQGDGGGAPYPADQGAQPPDQAPSSESYEPYRQRGGSGAYRPLDGSRRDSVPPARTATPSDPGGYGEPYRPAGPSAHEEHYDPVPPAAGGGPPEAGRGYYSESEIVNAGHQFFGSVSGGLASAVEWAFQKAGRPNGYILGQDAGGAVIAGLRYGEGTLHTKDAGNHRVYWQGPSVGYDLGAEGSKVMVLVYNLRDPSEIYNRFGGVQGAAYFVGGVGVQLQKSGDVTLAPIRSGVGVRLGANIGYLKYTRNPTWNPF
jgi:hypothetical protein